MQELARAKRAGLPVAMSQLYVKAPPVAQNAGPVYALLTQRLHDRPLAPDDLILDELSGSVMPSVRQIEETRASLNRRADLLRLVHRAAARSQCVFIRDWNKPNPADIRFPELAAVRHAAHLLTAESLVTATDGHGVAAVRNEALGFQIARHADSDHTLISYLVGLAVDAITLGGFRNIIYISHGDPRVANAVQQAIERDYQPQSLAASMRHEAAFQQGVITTLRRTGPDALDGLTGGSSGGQALRFPPVNPVAWQRFLDANGSYLLHIMPKAVAAVDLPYSQALAALNALTTEVMQPKDLTHLVAVITFPDATSVVHKRALVQARAETTRAAAALLVYRSSRGDFPADLEQALSLVPHDPYDGRLLSYKREGSGFVVYSTGPDGDFDGGTSSVKPPTNEAVFRYPVPAYDMARG